MPQAEESLKQYEYIKLPVSIAVKLGTTEALILAVLDKWINYHKGKELNWEKKPHFIDDRWSTYITADDLQAQIKVVSKKSIRNAVKHLCEENILIVSHHSRGVYRRTNWYSIDYDRLSTLIGNPDEEILEVAKSTTSTKNNNEILEVAKSTTTTTLEVAKSTTLEVAKSSTSYNRINTLDNINTLDDINSCSFRKQEHGKSREKFFEYITEELHSSGNFANTIICFLENYTLNGYGVHPSLTEEKINDISDEYYDAETRNKITDKDWECMIKEYFSQNFKEKSDHKIFHFFTPGILDNLYHHINDRAV